MLGIGFDVPDASCLILARPTLSEALHMQQMGRGIRTAAGKRDCLILDHSGNTLKHGLPIHFEVPELDAGEKGQAEPRKRKEKEPFVLCAHCGALDFFFFFFFFSCGLDRPDRRPKVIVRDGDLVAFGTAEEGEALALEERKRFYQGALGYVLQRNQKPGRAYHLTKERFKDFEPPWNWRNLPPLDPTPDDARWIRNQQANRAIRRRYAERRA